MEQEKINIIGVKTAHGFLITIFLGGGRYGNINKYIVNGKQPTGTFLESWGQVDAEPELVEKSVRQPNINHRFVLKDDIHWIDGSTLPKEIPKTEVMEEIDGACEWKDEFKPIQSMYYETSDPQPDRKEEVQFNYKTVLEVDDIKYADGFEYFTQPREYSYKIGNKDINFQDLSKILLPPIALPNSECFLSSKQSYDIIREHVKRNIDSRYAEVSSDYEFCFSVNKVVPLTTPIHRKQEIKKANGRSYAKPRYKEWLVSNRVIKTVFEMTSHERKYSGYTPIDGFRGKNQADLKNKIDEYLEKLIDRINEPLSDCPRCNGLGVVVKADG